MNQESTFLKESVFVVRRLLEPLDTAALYFPVALATAGAILFLAIRHRDELKQLYERVPRFLRAIPPILVAIVAWLLVQSLRTPVDFVVGIVLVVIVAALVAFPLFLLLLGLGLIIVLARGHRREAALVGTIAVVGVAAAATYAVMGHLVGDLEFQGEKYAWLMVLVPVLVIALAYVGAMYYHDAATVSWAWALFLALLRVTAYFLLAVCFLLPGCQEYDITIRQSKVLVLFDISGSMDAVDGQEGEGGITRQEKIVRLLTTPFEQKKTKRTFMEHLTSSTPVACYRIGGAADDEPAQFEGNASKSWSADEWRNWLRPYLIDKKDLRIPDGLTDEQQRAAYVQSKLALYAAMRDGTDVGGSVLQVLQREGNSRIQAVIVFSDGNSNRGDEEAIRQILERAGNKTRPIHVITVGVGDYKQPVRIRINPLVAPQAVRADDGAFEVRVPVFGDGLPGEPFEVTLEVQRVKDRNGAELKKEKVYVVAKQKGTFGGGGEFPYDEVVFKVNLEEITKIKAQGEKKELLQGQWNFVAKVPRHPREAPDKDRPIHESQVKPVMVNDSTLRVLLFSGGPSRDYQFVRTLVAREVDAQRARLSILLQTAKGLEDVHQDVEERFRLDDFPTKLERPAGGGKKGDADKEGDPMNLKSYDVIIAFDPDWSQLSVKQKDILKEWVEGDHGGGIIFVADQAHTGKLIPPVTEDLFKKWEFRQIYSLFPVTLARQQAALKGSSWVDSTVPYRLNFTGVAKGFDFIRLDDDSQHPLGGWDEFFGKLVETDFPGIGTKTHPERGFYSYFRVQNAKDGAEVIASFGDSKAPKTKDNKDQPYFVSLRVGKGKSFYVGSGEMWRLRMFKEEYHQRFWVKLARYVSSASGGRSFGRFAMAGEYVTGNIPIEAEVKDKDFFPLNPDTPPVVSVRKLDGSDKDLKLPTVELKPKKGQGSWRGVFTGNMRLDQTGHYEVRIDIPGTAESITQTFEVKSPNVEMSDLRTNFPKLFNMATDATEALLKRLDSAAREQLEAGRDRPKVGSGAALDTNSSARLFFRLASAQPVSQCITRVPPEEDKVKGAIRDLWDRGPEVYRAQSWQEIPWLVWTMYLLPVAAVGIVIVLMLIGRRWLAAVGAVVALVLIEAGITWVVTSTTPMELFQPSAYGVLLVVPSLVGLTAAGILLLAERYWWAVAIVIGSLIHIAALVGVSNFFEPEWPAMIVDFPILLMAIAFVLSLEWFTRKMLRLA